jgi:cytochrome P450
MEQQTDDARHEPAVDVDDRLVRNFDHLDPALDYPVLDAVYRGLSEGPPVTTTTSHGGFALVCGHAEILEVEKDWATYSSAGGVLHPPHEGRSRNIPTEYDPPEHTAYRKLFMDVLSVPRVRRIEPFLRDLTETVVREFVDSEEFDFVAGVAVQLPIRAIGSLLGWGESASKDIQAFATSMLEHLGTPKMAEAIQSFAALALAEIEDRRTNPRDDYMTSLIQLDFDGRPLTDAELLIMMQTFAFAGFETTAHAIGSLVHHLALHPELQDRLREQPQMVDNVVEEGLRMFLPVHTMFRTVTCPAQVGGVELDQDDRLVLMFGVANRDTSVFEDPHEFVADRANARSHLAFGIGTHYCAGAPLARAEMRILLDVLRAYPNYALAGEPRYLPQLMMGQMQGVDYLPLAFDRP